MDASGSNMRRFKWMRNEQKTFERSELDSKEGLQLEFEYEFGL